MSKFNVHLICVLLWIIIFHFKILFDFLKVNILIYQQFLGHILILNVNLIILEIKNFYFWSFFLRTEYIFISSFNEKTQSIYFL